MIVTNNETPPTDPWIEGGPIDSWPIFALGVHRLNAGIADAVVTGWQYTRHMSDLGQVLSRYIRGTDVDRAEDTLSRKTQLAYQRIVALSEAREATRVWEVRSLRIHALYLHAMWLHSLSGEEDVVIPYMSYFPELRELQEYPLSVYLQVAKREASRLPQAPLV